MNQKILKAMNKPTTCYFCYQNNYIEIYDGNPNDINELLISKIILTRKIYKDKLNLEIKKISKLPLAVEYFNILDLHSMYFKSIQLDKNHILKYIFPHLIHMDQPKIIPILENLWSELSLTKINEIMSNKLTKNILSMRQIREQSFMHSITTCQINYLQSYSYPDDLSIIITDDPNNDIILNKINRSTKRFNFIRYFDNGLIVPYINENHLKDYKNVNVNIINRIYERNIEINLDHPFCKDLENDYKILNN
jgi:hypothetical protein